MWGAGTGGNPRPPPGNLSPARARSSNPALAQRGPCRLRPASRRPVRFGSDPGGSTARSAADAPRARPARPAPPPPAGLARPSPFPELDSFGRGALGRSVAYLILASFPQVLLSLFEAEENSSPKRWRDLPKVSNSLSTELGAGFCFVLFVFVTVAF